MGATRANVSLALNGNPAVLTDNFLMRFAKAYSGMFSCDWLLTGDGEMLITNELKPKPVNEPAGSSIDSSSMLNALLAAKDETISAMQDQIAAKEEIIQAKDALIDSLQKQLAVLQSECVHGYSRPLMASEPLSPDLR
jgi:hypothetical protein